MDTKKEAQILKILAMYLEAFPQNRMEPSGLVIYAKALNKYSPETVKQAMDKLIMTSKFFPSVAEIIENIQSLASFAEGTAVLSEAEAWESAMRTIRDHGIYNQKPWEFENKNIEKAARMFGLMELAMLEMDDVNIARAQFTRFYRSVIDRDKDARQNHLVLSGQGIGMIGNIKLVKGQ
ncbi:replicative helicase loader/inhibitor [Anaerovibrio lipolyticus]|uniref:replicative helicase loader/inhibitor n=1 Tax=Anaerovibrio lipolyticus TaxID=82374 RepID=UPI0026ECDF6C|nr:replicative helicase loader/inhibitor [Anaerovibrio lipolyticus]MBE6105981.1 hypothetical protein [Anaerovibrio lipolyticus]